MYKLLFRGKKWTPFLKLWEIRLPTPPLVDATEMRTTVLDWQTAGHVTDRRRCSTPTSSASSAPISLATCSNVFDVGVPSWQPSTKHVSVPHKKKPLFLCLSQHAQMAALCISLRLMASDCTECFNALWQKSEMMFCEQQLNLPNAEATTVGLHTF